ncbi:MAG: sugar ABC transporter substrate-binding protein, partial [Chloroflexota bacterium]
MTVLFTLVTLLALGVAGISAQDATELSLWYHGAGNDAERSVLVSIIDDFNASQSDYVVVLEEFPQ